MSNYIAFMLQHLTESARTFETLASYQ